MVSPLSQETVKGNRRQAGSVETGIEKEVSMEQAAEQLPQRKVLLQSHGPCYPQHLLQPQQEWHFLMDEEEQMPVASLSSKEWNHPIEHSSSLLLRVPTPSHNIQVGQCRRKMTSLSPTPTLGLAKWWHLIQIQYEAICCCGQRSVGTLCFSLHLSWAF